jgi:hypothetical protein
MEKVVNPNLVDVLPRVAWAERSPAGAGLSVWIYGVGSRDLSKCRQVHPYAEYAQHVFIGVEEVGDAPQASLFKTDNACRWKFLRWISIPVSEPWTNDFAVFELDRVLDKNKRVRYAVSLNQTKEFNETTYPPLSGARPLKTIINEASVAACSRKDKYEGVVHVLQLGSAALGEKTKIVVTDQLAASPEVKTSFQVTLDGEWIFYQWASEELTAEKRYFSVVRLIKRTDPDRSWVGPKKDILINPWGAFITDIGE